MQFARHNGWDFCFARLLPSGDLDTTFNALGTPGKVVAPRDVSDTYNQYATSIVLQPDGKIVVAGYCSVNNIANAFMCLLRYEGNGAQPDVGFGSQGWANYRAEYISTQNNRVYGVALQPNGKIVLGAECSDRLCAVRFLGSGSIDTDFADNGLLITPNRSVSSVELAAVALRADGAILLAGWRNLVNGISSAYISATHSAGASLGSFVAPSCRPYRGIALQSDGKIVTIAATSTINGDFVVERHSGGEREFRECSLDVDGDGKVLATTDALIHARVSLGMSGAAVTSGITFAAHAARKTWPEIRTFLVTQCGMAIL